MKAKNAANIDTIPPMFAKNATIPIGSPANTAKGIIVMPDNIVIPPTRMLKSPIIS